MAGWSPHPGSGGGWSRTAAVGIVDTDVDAKKAAASIRERGMQRVRSGGNSEADKAREAGIRIEVVDGREERVDAQGFRERNVPVVERAVVARQGMEREKKGGLKRIVEGMGFGGGGKEGKEKISMRDVVGLVTAKGKADGTEEAHAQAALRWKEREREMQMQMQIQAQMDNHSDVQARSPTRSVSQTMGTTKGRDVTESPGDAQARHRPLNRSTTQTSWTEPGQGEERDRNSLGGDIGKELEGVMSSEEYAESYRGIIGPGPWEEG
ncbi:uncharacterized protein RAG0_07239 [Rhynchosporium agropyri]|uniref:Uncharacterized protein n=1 Tax=Rhynchosporium agropyri TaxID=914238 RepID=A0A1E1KKL1_9HELO|nr:uncharacterized protein RAG0_07239 [Rhynchosporium agropyri]